MSLSECYKECNYLRETDNRLMSHCIWETYYKTENTQVYNIPIHVWLHCAAVYIYI